MRPLQTLYRWLGTSALALTVSAGFAAAQSPPPADLPALAESGQPPAAGTPAVPPAPGETPVPMGGSLGGGPAAAPTPPPPTGPKWQTPLPRPGNFVVPPTGPGYYTLLDQLHGECRQAPPKYPYPRISPIFVSNADVNWSYLRNPANTEHDYADCLKFIPVGDHATVTTGGELRYRFMNEFNSNGRATGVRDSHDLYRVRSYADVWVNDRFRVFGEFLYADTTRRNLPPLATDIDRGDILNLFADLRVFEFGEKDNPVYLRLGRQELLYGSQRLVSTLDWVNTRRTFQGVKAFTRTEKWDFDVFAVQPVVPPQAGRFDSVDNNQLFSGAWFTYRNAPGQNIDLYYLNLDNTNPGAAVGNGGKRGAYNVNTLGTRFVGVKDNWMWDGEAMLQFGGYANQSIIAKSFVAGGGYQFKGLPWDPQLWAYYDYASGDPDPQATGTRRTFNQLFPFGHYYYGFTDLVGRQNINDWYLQGVMFPEKWLTCMLQFHVLRLDSNRDALYGPGGNVIRQDRTGRSGNDIGNNLDLLVNVHVSNHSDILAGYSMLFAGDYLRNTATGANRDAMSRNPELFYLQYSYRW